MPDSIRGLDGRLQGDRFFILLSYNEPNKEKEGKDMRKGLTEVVFIIDRSGSMRGLEADTIGGFNAMIEKQQKEEGEAYISTVLFDDQTEVLYDRVPVGKVEPMNDNQYFVRGCTALLDAIGKAIHHIGNVHKYARTEDVPEKTLFIITTDGMENASTMYNYRRIKHMIERQKEKYGWEFIFLGANIDAVEVAGRFGVGRSRAVRYESDRRGTELNYEVMSKMVSCARKASSASDMNNMFEEGEIIAEVRDDFEEYERLSKSDKEYYDMCDGDMEDLREIYRTMDTREKTVAELLFGVQGGKKHSVTETSKILGTSPGRVRQIATKILHKVAVM